MSLTPRGTIKQALDHYKAYDMPVKDIATMAGVNVKTIQRWAAKAGIVRDLRTAQGMSAKFRDYRVVSEKQKLNGPKRKTIPPTLRFKLLEAHPYCTACGAKPGLGVYLDIDHINNDPSDNRPENLQVLCHQCNMGKFHAHRREYLARRAA